MPRLNTYELAMLGRVLRETRRRREISIRNAAAAAGLNKDTLWGWEAGRHRPGLRGFEAICEVYEVSAREVIEEMWRRVQNRPL